MADNVFSSAPNSSGRQFGAVAGIAKLLGGGKGNDYRQKSALQNESHVQNIQQAVVGHVLGETAADSAHRRALAQNRQQNRFSASESAANRAHELEKQSQAHTQATDMHVLGMNSINTLAENKSVGSFKLPNGTSAQFNGVGEAQA